MARTILAVFALFVSAATLFAAPPPDDMVQELTRTIRKHCPEAKIEVTEDEFVARSGTMMFTLHSRSKSGEVYPQTYQQEGPNFKGFILRVALHDGKYEGAAVVPQTLQGPYFPTFIDAPPVEKGHKHYQVHFSYGSRLDADLKKAIFEVIPKTRFQPGAAPEDVDKEAGALAPAKAPDIKVDFEEASLSIRPSIIQPQQPESIRVRGDGICGYRIEERPARGAEPRWDAAYLEHRLDPERLRRLEGFLKKTDWLSAPGYEGPAGHTDAAKYTLTVKRKGETRTIGIDGEKGEPYKSLLSFFRGIALQENLLYRLERLPAKEQNEACRQIENYVRAEQGGPYAKPPFEIDLRRYEPTFRRYVRYSFRHSGDELVPAVRLLGHVRSVSERESIAALANDRDPYVRDAVAEALGRLGGQESVSVLRRMVRSTNEAAWQLVRLGPVAVPTVVEVIESGTDPHDEREPGFLDYQRLIRAYLDHWDEVPRPVDPRVLAAVRHSMAVPKVKTYGTEYHQKLLDLASRPTPPK
jgi:hypothetical protein